MCIGGKAIPYILYNNVETIGLQLSMKRTQTVACFPTSVPVSTIKLFSFGLEVRIRMNVFYLLVPLLITAQG